MCVCASEAQMPVAASFTSTSSARGSESSNETISSGSPGAVMRDAAISISGAPFRDEVVRAESTKKRSAILMRTPPGAVPSLHGASRQRQ